jgi:hypothetical protein
LQWRLLVIEFPFNIVMRTQQSEFSLCHSVKGGTIDENGPIDFAQSWAIHMKKSN